MTTPDQARAIAASHSASQRWLDVPGYEGLYSINNSGDVISLPRMSVVKKYGVKAYRIPISGRMLARTFSRKGYAQVTLYKNGKQRTCELHRLVCEAFHGPAPVGYQAAHLNGNRADPSAENLSWVTPAENQRHRRQHGTMFTGEAVTTSKITSENACEIIKRRSNGQSMCSIARDFGISEKAIRKIVSGEMWADQTASVRAILQEQSNGA